METRQQASLLKSYLLGDLKLRNRVVMASLTRGRADNEALAPTDMHTLYYAQRASAGLILSECIWISRHAIGFINIPGIYSPEQVEGWKQVTTAVHQLEGRIFAQLVHSGAVSHADFFEGRKPLGPSAINPGEKTFTPKGFKDTETPDAFTTGQIGETVAEFRMAAENAKTAGFDGIEIHAQLFTLIPQFLNAATNQRTDQYGGSIENRCRLLFEILDAVLEVWSSQRIGVKFTPAGFNPGLIRPDAETVATYAYILSKLNDYKLAYVQIVRPVVDLKGTVLDGWSEDYFAYFRRLYAGTLMVNGGFTKESAEEILDRGEADLVSFGEAYIANPDLVKRFEQQLPLSVANKDQYYSVGTAGYNDYPAAEN